MPDPTEIANENEEALKSTLEEIEKQEAETTTPDPEQTPEEEPAEEITEPEGETTSEEEPEEQESEPEDTTSPDYKKKFSESSREAQVLLAKNKQYEKVSEVPEPTEEELKAEFPEWEEMSATERKLATQNVWNDRRFAVIEQVNKESKDVEAWNGKVDTFVTDPKVLNDHPELEGKTEDFKIFATKPSRRGVELEDLVLAFNGELARNKPAPKKGQMFETGTSGPNSSPKPKDNKISVEEAAVLQQTNYKEWKEKLQAGLLKTE